MTATTLLYNQYLQTITPPRSNPPCKSLKISSSNPPEQSPSPPLSSPSRLFALPLELRLQIYSHTLLLHLATSPKHATHTNAPLFNEDVSTSLLLVNRQIYHEARLLPLNVNTFIFTKCFGSSIFSARRFLAKLSEEQRSALRNVEVAVVGREIVEGWRREEGWEVVVAMLSHCRKVNVKVRIQEGDVWIGDGAGGMGGWLANGGGDGGNVFPGLPTGTRWGEVKPVRSQGREGWVQKLLQGGERGEGVKLEFSWVCSGRDVG